jgi:hypothetical protein
MSREQFQKCIDACIACAIECEHCATSCLREDDVKMLTRCIAKNRESAAVCRAAAELMTISGDHAYQLCQLCAEVCDHCAAECEQHAHMEHCQLCAEECRSCAEKCRTMAEEHV